MARMINICKNALFLALPILGGCAAAATNIKPFPQTLEQKAIQLTAQDTLILENAVKNQTIMFGESHLSQKDNDYVIKLLPELKKLRYEYFAMERDASLNDCYYPFHTQYNEFLFEQKYSRLHNYKRDAEIIKAARNEGLKIVFYDENPEKFGDGTIRNQLEFNNLKKLIFNKEPHAKVIVFCGAKHISEKPGFDITTKKSNEKQLGCFLDEYTNGRNYSVCLAGNDNAIITSYPDIRIEIDN